jgi:hypothetical protein
MAGGVNLDHPHGNEADERDFALMTSPNSSTTGERDSDIVAYHCIRKERIPDALMSTSPHDDSDRYLQPVRARGSQSITAPCVDTEAHSGTLTESKR